MKRISAVAVLSPRGKEKLLKKTEPFPKTCLIWMNYGQGLPLRESWKVAKIQKVSVFFWLESNMYSAKHVNVHLNKLECCGKVHLVQ